MTTLPAAVPSRTSGPVLTEKVGAVAVVTLNRPATSSTRSTSRCGWRSPTWIEAADRDPTVARPSCSPEQAGRSARAETSRRWNEWLRTDALERAQLAQRVIRAIWSTDKPVVAAVEGSGVRVPGTAWPQPATAWWPHAECTVRDDLHQGRLGRATWESTSRCRPASGWHVPGRC